MRVRGQASDLFDRWVGVLRRASYLKKWAILGVMIGVVAGLGAVVFVHAIRLCSWLFLDLIGGYVPPSSVGEGNSLGSSFARPWAVPLAVGLGGLISGLLVARFAPEAEGHGTDAAIEAVHHNPRGMRARASVVKIVASAVTIGSGGSAGREGPTAQISAGFASMLARRLDLTPNDARIAVTAGIGSGIGAIFRAPLGGAVLGAELLYRDDIEAEAIYPDVHRQCHRLLDLRRVRGVRSDLRLHPTRPFRSVATTPLLRGDRHRRRCGRVAVCQDVLWRRGRLPPLGDPDVVEARDRRRVRRSVGSADPGCWERGTAGCSEP